MGLLEGARSPDSRAWSVNGTPACCDFILQGNSLCLLYGLMKGMSRKRERGIRFISGRESTFIVVADFAREQPVAFKACLLRAQRHFHATGYTRAGRVDARATHGCRVVRAKAGACCRILPARGLLRALFVVPPCRAPASRAAYFADIPFFVRRVPSKAKPVTGFGNNCKKSVFDIAVWGERCGYTGGSLFGDAPYTT